MVKHILNTDSHTLTGKRLKLKRTHFPTLPCFIILLPVLFPHVPLSLGPGGGLEPIINPIISKFTLWSNAEFSILPGSTTINLSGSLRIKTWSWFLYPLFITLCIQLINNSWNVYFFRSPWICILFLCSLIHTIIFFWVTQTAFYQVTLPPGLSLSNLRTEILEKIWRTKALSLIHISQSHLGFQNKTYPDFFRSL